MSDRPTGILAAMDEEVRRIRERVEGGTVVEVGGRAYLLGSIADRPVVVAFSRWGKVAAASTATTLIDRFGVSRVIFTGVAGAVDADLGIGDLVVARGLVQHDLDARPLLARFEVPLLDRVEMPTDPQLVAAAVAAVREVLDRDLATMISDSDRARFGIATPKVREGLVASGDRFIADPAETSRLRRDLPGLLAVEMEGAAVAQVCFEHGVPCVVVRAISDRADHGAAIDFGAFVSDVASRYTERVVQRLMERL